MNTIIRSASAPLVTILLFIADLKFMSSSERSTEEYWPIFIYPTILPSTTISNFFELYTPLLSAGIAAGLFIISLGSIPQTGVSSLSISVR